MNIYDNYPTEIYYNGKTIKLNLSYDRVLRVLDIQEDDRLTAQDRIEAQCALLLARGYKDMPKSANDRAKLLNSIFDLFPKSENNGERFIDFHQDAQLIRSAFFRIGVDLLKNKIHFFQFMELLADLPSDTALMRTVEIRQKPIPKPTKDNAEQIAALQRAKAKVAIKMSEDERRKRFVESLKNSNVLRG